MPPREPPYRATIEALFQLFSNALLEKFSRSGDTTLSREEVEAITAYFRAGSPELDAFYAQLFSAYDRVNAAMAMNRMRSDEFNRLLVESFEDYLVDRSVPKGAKTPADRVPREVLPAFFHAVRQILGTEFLEKSAFTCREVRRVIQARDGEAFTWDVFFADAAVRRVQQRAISRFIVYFREDFDKKKVWIVKALNYNAGGGDMRGSVASSYLFNEGRLKILMMAMIRRVDPSGMDAGGKAELLKNIGEERLKTVERVKMDVKLLDDKRLF
ncbi:hypothetical protein [Oleispirillum naphthae]|uniref:hypothetical protein n=1 Tax=Oleispirillum naphthae TaxID=2838853 RepID=UPI0030822112